MIAPSPDEKKSARTHQAFSLQPRRKKAFSSFREIIHKIKLKESKTPHNDIFKNWAPWSEQGYLIEVSHGVARTCCTTSKCTGRFCLIEQGGTRNGEEARTVRIEQTIEGGRGKCVKLIPLTVEDGAWEECLDKVSRSDECLNKVSRSDFARGRETRRAKLGDVKCVGCGKKIGVNAVVKTYEGGQTKTWWQWTTL